MSKSKSHVLTKFCTRERFAEYLKTEVKQINPAEFSFSDEEIEIVLNEHDPFFTGVIQISLVQRFYCEEIKYQRQVQQNKPEEILNEIRAIAFPRKRIPLQQSIASADCSSDGYINETQFIEAFYRAGVNIRRDSLEFLFDVMAERFTSAKVKLSDEPAEEEKFLNIFFFSNRLFTKRESEEVDEVDVTLQLLKSALIYKGLDFSAIFSEKSDEEPKKRFQRKGIKGAPKEKKQVVQKDTNIDLMSYHTRFA